MKAMVLDSVETVTAHPLKLRDVPKPSIKANEVLVRVRACGVCRTDLHVIEGDLPKSTLPIIPGHQVVGTVEAAGTACVMLQVGDRVGVPWLGSTCGSCEYCKAGNENLCPNSVYTGYHRHGGYAEYIAADEAYCYPVPAQFSDVQAAPLLCAGIIGYRALQRSEPRERGTLAIFGFGSSAHITIQIARHRGMEVFVSTRGEEHQRLARDLGATWVGGPMERPPLAVDSAIVFAPAGEIVPVAMRALKNGGTTSIAGIHLSPIPEMDYASCLFHEKKLCSVEANTRRDGARFLREAGAVPVITEVEVFPLEEANAALCKVKEGRVRGSAVLTI